jgi:SOS-response transcriptional repressor LexA
VDGSFFVRARSGDLAVLGVEEGDLVLFTPTTAQSAEDGAVVLARTGGRTVFHRVRKNGRGLVLESLGPAAERVLVEDADQIVLLGRVAGFYRKVEEAGPPAPTRH